ncbi:MAG: LysR substrate-binding domain-containing protein [Betaproteobacteria bacterium]
MNHRHLQLLVALDEHRNLARVAERLNVTPPAVSKSLHDIERELGAELFTRGPRGVTPTIYGECMIRHAQAVLAQLGKATLELRALKDGSLGSTALGVLPAAAPLLAPLAIAKLKERAPLSTVLLRDGTIDALIPDLHQGKLDLIVGTVPSSRFASGLVVEMLYDNDALVVVSRVAHPLTRRSRLPLTRLLEYPWIIPPSGTSVGDSFKQLLAKHRLSMTQNYVESGSIVANKTLIQQTDTLGFFSRHIAEFYAEQKVLAVLNVELGSSVGPVGAMWIRDRRLSPTSQLAVTCLREAAAVIRSQARA